MVYLSYILTGLIFISVINCRCIPQSTKLNKKEFEKPTSVRSLKEEIELLKRQKPGASKKCSTQKDKLRYFKLTGTTNALEKELNIPKSRKRRIDSGDKSAKENADIRNNKPNKTNCSTNNKDFRRSLPKEPKESLNYEKNKDNLVLPELPKQSEKKKIEELFFSKELIDALEKALGLSTKSDKNIELREDLAVLGKSDVSNIFNEDVSKTINDLDENDSEKNNSIDVRSTVFMHKSKYKRPTISQAFSLKKDDFGHTVIRYGQPPENPQLHDNFLKQLLFSSKSNEMTLEDPYRPSNKVNSSDYSLINKAVNKELQRTTIPSHSTNEPGLMFDYDERFKLMQLFKSPVIRQKYLNKGNNENTYSKQQPEDKNEPSVVDPRLSLPSSYYFPINPDELERLTINIPVPGSTRKYVLDEIDKNKLMNRKYSDHDQSLYVTSGNHVELKKGNKMEKSGVYCLYYICKLKKVTPGQGNGDSVEMECKCRNENGNKNINNALWHKKVVNGGKPTPMFRTKVKRKETRIKPLE